MWVLDIGPDTHYHIDDIIAEGDKVAVRMTVSGTHTGPIRDIPPTGKRISVDYVHWFRLADGKVAELWAVRDDLNEADLRGAVLRQVGLRWADLSEAKATEKQLATALSLEGATMPDGSKHA